MGGKKLDEKQKSKLIVQDETCENLLNVMMVEGINETHPKRFNELFRLLRHYRLKTSKPTFNQHLKHLIEQNLVKRNKIEKQKVLYYLNSENPIIFNAMNKLGFLIKVDKELRKKVLEKKEMSTSKFIEWIDEFFSWTYLHKISNLLKTNITKDPKTRFDHTLEFRVQNLYLTTLIQTIQVIFALRADQEEKDKILKYVEEAIDKKAFNLLKLMGFSSEDIDLHPGHID
jgi:DNA-binding HxlR family transcriptional regulator